jgi:hypothetical protein
MYSLAKGTTWVVRVVHIVMLSINKAKRIINAMVYVNSGDSYPYLHRRRGSLTIRPHHVRFSRDIVTCRSLGAGTAPCLWKTCANVEILKS